MTREEVVNDDCRNVAKCEAKLFRILVSCSGILFSISTSVPHGAIQRGRNTEEETKPSFETTSDKL